MSISLQGERVFQESFLPFLELFQSKLRKTHQKTMDPSSLAVGNGADQACPGGQTFQGNYAHEHLFNSLEEKKSFKPKFLSPDVFQWGQRVFQ